MVFEEDISLTRQTDVRYIYHVYDAIIVVFGASWTMIVFIMLFVKGIFRLYFETSSFNTVEVSFPFSSFSFLYGIPKKKKKLKIIF